MASFTTPPITAMTDTFTTLIANLKILVEDVLGFFPVGTIYESTRSTDPSTFRPGTWTQMQDGRVLIAASTAHPAGSTGGEETHLLTVAEMPKHTHIVSPAGKAINVESAGSYVVPVMTDAGNSAPYETSYRGDNAAHNNMQPYRSVYMWERTA